MSGYSIDRGISPAAPRRRSSGRVRHIAAAAIGVFASGIVGTSLWWYYHPTEPPPKEKLPQLLGSVIDQSYQKPALPVIKPEPKPDAPPAPPLTDAETPWDQPPAANKWMNQNNGGSTSAAGVSRPNAIFVSTKKAPPAAPTTSPQQPPDETKGDIIYAKAKMEGAQAGRMGNPTLRLDRGLLPCILDWDVDSTFGGPIQCHVPMDIRPHGVTLLDRGTIISGNYSGDVRTGQKRLSATVDIIENRATDCFATPGEFPVTEANGMAGVSGSVDNHYGERFAAAAAFAFTQAAVSIAQSIISSQNQGNRNNSYYNFGGGSYGNNGIEQLAQTILQAQINIPPTVTLNRGDTIAVVIRRPIDFSHCYGVAIRR